MSPKTCSRRSLLDAASSLSAFALLALLAGPAEALAAAARLAIVNDRSDLVGVEVDRQEVGKARPRATSELSLAPGTRELRLRAPGGEVLYQGWHQARPGQTITLRLEAIDAPVRVSNPLDRSVSLHIDGGEALVLAPWATTTVVLPVGTRALELRLNGRVIARESLRVEARGPELSWLPDPARVGDLVVENPHPIAVRLRLPSGREQVVAAFGRATLADLPEGPVLVEVLRADGGERLESLRTQVWAFEAVRRSVAAPRLGIIALTNRHPQGPVHVEIDGRPARTLGPREAARLELSPGRHLVVLRDGRGRELERRAVVVDRYEVLAMDVGLPVEHRRPGVEVAVVWSGGGRTY